MSDIPLPDLDVPAFDYDPRTRVVFGAGALDRLGESVREIGGSRALLVTDKGLADAGHEERAMSILQGSAVEVVVYDDVASNPTTDDVARGAEFAQSRKIDVIIGLGGGSSMDCGKGINFLLTNGGRMEDYRGVGKASQPMLPFIAVPTTAGTGSEAQSFAVIADPATHMKMACGDKKAAAAIAVLDPELTLTMPAAVTAATGIDALSHALETYVTTRRTPVSQLFSRQSWELLSRAFPAVLASPNDARVRGAMLLGAHLAGAAIENSMLGATHALANPVTAHYGVTHGLAIGALLPSVIRYNAAAVPKLYGELAEGAGLASADDPEAGERLAAFICEIVGRAGAPTSLTAWGVESEMIPRLAAEAAEQWTGRFNPRPVKAPEFEELYRCALSDVSV